MRDFRDCSGHTSKKIIKVQAYLINSRKDLKDFLWKIIDISLNKCMCPHTWEVLKLQKCLKFPWFSILCTNILYKSWWPCEVLIVKARLASENPGPHISSQILTFPSRVIPEFFFFLTGFQLWKSHSQDSLYYPNHLTLEISRSAS